MFPLLFTGRSRRCCCRAIEFFELSTAVVERDKTRPSRWPYLVFSWLVLLTIKPVLLIALENSDVLMSSAWRGICLLDF